MNLNRIISIFIACFLWISSIGGQSYYQVLSDYTGQLRNGGTIEQAATNLANLIPANIRSQFKVLEYDNYIYDENKFGSMENSWADAEAKANAASPYYILFTYLSNNKSFNFDVRVKIKLPNAGTFNVIDADFIDVLKGIAEAKARVQLLSPNVDLGFVEAINGVATKLKGRLDCGNGPDCAEYSIQEMIDALHSAGYLQLDAQEVIIDSVPPGNGVIGTINAKVSFEDYSTDFGLQFKYFLQDGGSYARIRGFSKANSSTFKVNMPTGENWMDLVCIKNGSQVLVFQNLAISSGSNFRSNAFVAPIVYHALRAITSAGKEALIDFLFQLTFESISTWKDPYTAWKNMDVDGASVASAAARGSLDYFVGLFSGGKVSVSKYGNATLEGISASVGYVIDNPRTFTLEECYNTFLSASITALGVSLAPMFVKYTKKIIPTIKFKGKEYIDAINNYPFGKKFLTWFRKQCPEVDDEIRKHIGFKDIFLINQARSQGIKITPIDDDVFGIFKGKSDGKIIWLEKGNSTSGWQHSMEKHGHEFTNKGWNLDEFKELILLAARDGINTGKIVKGSKDRPIFRVNYKGKEREIGISISSNGYIVGAQSVSGTW